MKIIYSPQFLRSFKKLSEEIRDILRIKETLFRKNQFDPRLKTHKLKGKNEWAFWVTYKIRAVFIFHEEVIIFINIGDHSIYR